MPRILLLISPVLACCSPAPQKAAMPSPSANSGTSVQGPAEFNAPGERGDSPEEAQGRRILSTAFVRIGPDGHLTVELRDGHTLVLRDVVMRPRDYCGMRVASGTAPSKFCGEYADVGDARPGGTPIPDQPGLTPAGPVGTARSFRQGA